MKRVRRLTSRSPSHSLGRLVTRTCRGPRRRPTSRETMSRAFSSALSLREDGRRASSSASKKSYPPFLDRFHFSNRSPWPSNSKSNESAKIPSCRASKRIRKASCPSPMRRFTCWRISVVLPDPAVPRRIETSFVRISFHVFPVSRVAREAQILSGSSSKSAE